MDQQKWEIIKQCARLENTSSPVALIIDSPWMPGYLGISTIDYLSVPEVWLQANLQVEREYPGILFLPGFWVEMGMTAEPSALGCKLSFYKEKTPTAHPLFEELTGVDRLAPANPLTDGLMPFVLNLYRRMEPKVNDAGHLIKIVAARGPLTVATHLMGVSNFLLELKTHREATHRFLRITTDLVRDWLHAQGEALKAVEGILVLDDVAGFLSAKDYREFAHPYLKEIFDAFPGLIKIFHNDTNNPVSFPYLKELGIHIFNFTHLQPLKKVRELVGPDICLMGNVPPLDILVRGTSEDVRKAAKECLETHPQGKGLILSAGGGTSPGTPRENIQALMDAVT